MVPLGERDADLDAILRLDPVRRPLSGLEVLLASGRASSTLLLGIAATALAAMAVGRLFCSWLCPLGLLLDLYESIRLRLTRFAA